MPVSLEQAKALGLVLGKYRDDYFSWVVALWAFAYLFMQTFVIPLTLPLCLLAGYLFPPSHMALLMVCTASATGAAGAYGLSYFLGRDLVRYYVPDKLALWEGRVKKHSDNLLFYTIFLRCAGALVGAGGAEGSGREGGTSTRAQRPGHTREASTASLILPRSPHPTERRRFCPTGSSTLPALCLGCRWACSGLAPFSVSVVGRFILFPQ